MIVQNNNADVTVNNFVGIEELPYKVFIYLLKNKSDECEDLWKALYYPTVDALSKPNLTTKQKRSLIWKGEPNENNYKIFNKPLVSDSMVDATDMIQLRMFRFGTTPIERLDANILFEIDVYTNDKTSVLINEHDYLVERTDFLETRLLSLLVGVDLGLGYNFFQFDRNLSTYNRSYIGINNSKAFFGRTFVLGLEYSNPSSGNLCQ